MPILRVGNAIYRRVVAQMTDEQAAKTADGVASDIGALALYMREQKSPAKEIEAVEGIAGLFRTLADRIVKKGLGKEGSFQTK